MAARKLSQTKPSSVNSVEVQVLEGGGICGRFVLCAPAVHARYRRELVRKATGGGGAAIAAFHLSQSFPRERVRALSAIPKKGQARRESMYNVRMLRSNPWQVLGYSARTYTSACVNSFSSGTYADHAS